MSVTAASAVMVGAISRLGVAHAHHVMHSKVQSLVRGILKYVDVANLCSQLWILRLVSSSSLKCQ